MILIWRTKFQKNNVFIIKFGIKEFLITKINIKFLVLLYLKFISANNYYRFSNSYYEPCDIRSFFIGSCYPFEIQHF